MEEEVFVENVEVAGVFLLLLPHHQVGQQAPGEAALNRRRTSSLGFDLYNFYINILELLDIHNI